MASSPSTPPFSSSFKSRLDKKKLKKLPLTEQRRPRTSIQLPPQFRTDDDEEEEQRKRGGMAADDPVFQERSLYGMIAQTGSIGNFTQGWPQEVESEDEGDGDVEGNKSRRESMDTVKDEGAESGRKTSSEGKQKATAPKPAATNRKGLSETKLMRSFFKPPPRESEEAMSQSGFLPTREGEVEVLDVESDAPVMDRKLQARAKAEAESSVASSPSSREETRTETKNQKAPVSLSRALADIFQLEEPEEVISEFACWYLQSILLQGYMYITQKHVCFYAYLQKKGNTVTKSGHLGKRGKQNPRYNRYWFTLKGDIFSYFANAAQPYFPSGTIDLRFAISAELAPEKGKEPTEATFFTVTTDKRTYYFKADSVPSAKEWVKQLQKVIFRSHNDGDSVKILISLENIVDVEASPMVGQADTVRVRVIDNEETFAVDEHFFTFFKNSKDALNLLNTMTQGNDAEKALKEASGGAGRRGKSRASSGLSRLNRASAGPAREKPGSSTSSRSSSEHERSTADRGSSGANRKIAKQNRRSSQSPLSPSAQDLTDSLATSSDHTPSSPSAGPSDVDMSASQMLTGDGAFGSPTLRMPQTKHAEPRSAVDRLRHEAQGHERVRFQPASSKQTEESLSDSQSSVRRKSSDKSRQSSLEDESKLQASNATVGTRPLLIRPVSSTLQQAASMVGYVRDQGKRMGSYLGGSPREYYGKFSGALVGGKRHYSEADGLAPEDRIDDPEDQLETAEHERRFQKHFALPETEKLVAVFYASLHRVLPLYGKIYMSNRHFCFRSLLYGTRTKIIIPFKEIDNVEKEKGFRLGYPGMVLVVRGHEELFFDFKNPGLRDDCVVTVLKSLDVIQDIEQSAVMSEEQKLEADAAAAENELLQTARKVGEAHHDRLHPEDVEVDLAPIFFDDPSASMLEFKPAESLRITCLTIGSRGDVQPYIALCKGFLAEGHRPKIATHIEFKDWVEGHGIEFVEVGGNPAELMQLCVEYGMFTPQFIYETNYKFRGWLDTLLETAWGACQNTDLLIESPSAMAGIHIAEALGIPYFRAFTMPWTRTRAYPHAFAACNSKMGGQYNISTYTVFENIFWQMTANQVNRWRAKTLQIGPTSMGKMQQNKIPFLYNFSPSVVVPPLDFSDWVRVTGYWFLDEGENYTPPKDLSAFIKKARDDKMKLVYIGFGSVVVSDSKAMTKMIVDAVLKADVRCILSKGWSDRMTTKDSKEPEEPLPPSIFRIISAPHDWLFKQVDAAVHHGGAGTTGASLRAGIPTIIKPFFGDQFFFASRVEDIGVGIRIQHITQNSLGKAVWLATHDERMRTKARLLGERIRAEDGVQTAINAIYRDLEYAKTLIRRKNLKRIEAGDGQSQAAADDDEDENEESWTFIDDEDELEALRNSGDPVGWDVSQRQQQQSGKGRKNSLGSMVLRGRLG